MQPGPISAPSHTRFPANTDDGYVADVRQEKQQKFYEVYLSPPQGETKADYRSYIFNARLTQEFKTRYREIFGYIDTDSLAYAANRFTAFDENRGRSVGLDELQRKRRAYAEYMMRRLGEFHVDNYFKSQPSMREVYELKEKLSNVQVQVGPSFKMDVHYSFSDNSAELIFKNPYCDAKWRLEMNPAAIGPSNIQENRLYIGKQLNSKHTLTSSIITQDGFVKLEWWNTYAFGMATQFHVMAPFKENGYTPRQSSIGAAVGHAF